MLNGRVCGASKRGSTCRHGNSPRAVCSCAHVSVRVFFNCVFEVQRGKKCNNNTEFC